MENTNKMNKKIDEIQGILDKNYFYTHISIKNTEEFEWVIYYKNLPYNQYFSEENTELLSSNKNSIEDIYTLKRNFEIEKQRVLNKNLSEFIKLDLFIFKQINKVDMALGETITAHMIILMIFNIINLFSFQDSCFAFLIFMLTALNAIFLIWKHRELQETTREECKMIKEDFIKEKIKREGLYFIKNLKKKG